MKATLSGIPVLLAMTMVCVAAPQTQALQRGVLDAELSVPFGTAQGKLLLLGDYLVFVDNQQMDASFVIPKAMMENLSADGTTITVVTRSPVHNRSGEVSRLSFRIAPGGDPGEVTGWYGGGISRMPVSASREAGSASREAASSMMPAGQVYQAQHNHRIGSCNGRLIVGRDQLSYESVDDVSDSRRWEYSSIQEIKHPNPYELEVKPFSGGNYKFKLEGTGMGPAEYKALVDKVTAARTRK